MNKKEMVPILNIISQQQKGQELKMQDMDSKFEHALKHLDIRLDRVEEGGDRVIFNLFGFRLTYGKRRYIHVS